MDFSIVIPIYNEADSIEELYQRLKKTLDALEKEYEIIFVDDGSKDDSLKLLKAKAAQDDCVVVVELSRNFGQTAGIAAGFEHSKGDIIIPMDGDLQHAPEDIPSLIDKIYEGYDIASGWRKERKDNLVVRRFPSRMANIMIQKISGVDIHDFGTTFKAYRRFVVENIKLYGDFHRFIPALASSIGARIAEVPIQNINRPKGKSNYGLGRIFRVFLDILLMRYWLSSSTRPLHFFGKVFMLFGGLSFLGFLFLVYKKFIVGVSIFAMHGPLFLTCIFLALVSIQFLAIGFLADIIMRTYYESQDKKIYFVREIYQKEKNSV